MSDLFDQSGVVERVFINVNTTPFTGVVFVNRNNSNPSAFPSKVLFKMLRGPWFANDASFAGVLTVGFCAIDLIGAIGLL